MRIQNNYILIIQLLLQIRHIATMEPLQYLWAPNMRPVSFRRQMIWTFNPLWTNAGSTSLQSNLHSLPSYACDDKHCYGGNEANSCWQDNDHVDSQHHIMRALFSASTHREAEWSISHSTRGKAFLALKCATVDLPSQSYRWWRLGGCLTLPTTTTSCMW